MQSFLHEAWSFQYSFLPCITAYLIFDAPILVRRFTRKVYVPIYFAFFPIGYSDELLAKYFDEDDFWVVGGPFPPNKMKTARLKIVTVSVVSLALTMTISPLLAGYFGSVVLTDHQFTQFLWTLGVLKAGFLLWSLYDLVYGFRISQRVPPMMLAFVYICYWILLIYFTVWAKTWVDFKYAIGGTAEVFRGILDFVIWDIGVGILFVSAAGAIIGWWVTEIPSETDA